MLKIALESLGCSKNLVDAEIMMGILNEKGYKLTGSFEDADVILVNTCGFIESAKQESIQTILEFAQLKETGNLKLLIVTGCLAQRYADELKEEIPEIDAIVGTGSYQNIDEILAELSEKHQIVSLNNIEFAYDENLPRYVSTPSHMAYLKIGEGCDNKCTYCIIPKIRGKFRSRLEKNILDEVNLLVNNGVKEIILIAQDLTDYGVDIYGKRMLHDLVRKISLIDGVEWIRLLYCYPEEITDELIEEIANNDKVVKYLDLPIQHISSKVLKQMGRRTNKETIIDKIETLRNKVPNIALRTSLIVGFPGETEEEFNELATFLKDYKLENVGVFAYSQEEDTPAAIMDGQIEENIKKERQNTLMAIQRDVVKEQIKLKIGNIYDTIIDSNNGEYFIGRNYEMAPEIDGLIYIKKHDGLSIGDIIKVKVTDVMEYDLIGEIFDELSK